MDGWIGDDKRGMFAAQTGTAEGGVTKRILWMVRGAERKGLHKSRESEGKERKNCKTKMQINLVDLVSVSKQ